MNSMKMAIAFYAVFLSNPPSILNHSSYPAWLPFDSFGALRTTLAFTIRSFLSSELSFPTTWSDAKAMIFMYGILLSLKKRLPFFLSNCTATLRLLLLCLSKY